MNLHIAYHIIAIGVTIAVWNAYVILWGVHKNLPEWAAKRKHYSNIWHAVGLILRCELVALPAYLLAWHPGAGIDWLLYVNWAITIYLIMGPIYDLIINWIRNRVAGYPELLYVDDKGVNALFLWAFKTEKAVWIFRLLLLLANIGLWIYYFI